MVDHVEHLQPFRCRSAGTSSPPDPSTPAGLILEAVEHPLKECHSAPAREAAAPVQSPPVTD